jgi:hypothetical protein
MMCEEDSLFGGPAGVLKKLGTEEYSKYSAKQRLYHIYKKNNW